MGRGPSIEARKNAVDARRGKIFTKIIPGADEDRNTEAAIEAGADAVVAYPDDGSVEVMAAPEVFESVKAAMCTAGLAPELAEVTMRADTDVAVSGETGFRFQ